MTDEPQNETKLEAKGRMPYTTAVAIALAVTIGVALLIALLLDVGFNALTAG